MREGTVPHEIESETGVSYDLGLFLMSCVLAGRIIEREMGISVDLGSFLMSCVLVGHKIESGAGLYVSVCKWLSNYDEKT